MKSETYPLALRSELLDEVRRTGLSLADAMRQSLRLGLPKLREQLTAAAALAAMRARSTRLSRGAIRLQLLLREAAVDGVATGVADAVGAVDDQAVRAWRDLRNLAVGLNSWSGRLGTMPLRVLRLP